MENIQNKIEVVCAECGKHEFVAPSRAKKYLCCSRECLGRYNSKRYNKQVELTCPICGKKYTCKVSKINHHKTCGNKTCRSKWLSLTRTGQNNSNYKVVDDLLNQSINEKDHDKSRTIYLHIAKKYLGVDSITKLPKGYVIHHKDANHLNNNPKNLVMIPKNVHRLIHTWFGNILIHALHSNIISREIFFNMCNKEQKDFYKEIIDLNITHQVVVKQGELLENPEEDNQQPSIYRNIIEGSTTNERVLASNVEDSNFDTSALPETFGDDIV